MSLYDGSISNTVNTDTVIPFSRKEYSKRVIDYETKIHILNKKLEMYEKAYNNKSITENEKYKLNQEIIKIEQEKHNNDKQQKIYDNEQKRRFIHEQYEQKKKEEQIQKAKEEAEEKRMIDDIIRKEKQKKILKQKIIKDTIKKNIEYEIKRNEKIEEQEKINDMWIRPSLIEKYDIHCNIIELRNKYKKQINKK